MTTDDPKGRRSSDGRAPSLTPLRSERSISNEVLRDLHEAKRDSSPSRRTQLLFLFLGVFIGTAVIVLVALLS